MLELWSREQILEVLPKAEFYRIGLMLSTEPDPQGMSVAGKTSGDRPVPWEVVEYRWIPGESITATLRLVGKNLYVRGISDVSGVKLEQVFRRKRMMPVFDYVDVATLNGDPGVSTMFE
jgi:hypothetical protein